MAEVKAWITIHGVHVPIMEGESKARAVAKFIKKNRAKKKDTINKKYDDKQDVAYEKLGKKDTIAGREDYDREYNRIERARNKELDKNKTNIKGREFDTKKILAREDYTDIYNALPAKDKHKYEELMSDYRGDVPDSISEAFERKGAERLYKKNSDYYNSRGKAKKFTLKTDSTHPRKDARQGKALSELKGMKEGEGVTLNYNGNQHHYIKKGNKFYRDYSIPAGQGGRKVTWDDSRPVSAKELMLDADKKGNSLRRDKK